MKQIAPFAAGLTLFGIAPRRAARRRRRGQARHGQHQHRRRRAARAAAARRPGGGRAHRRVPQEERSLQVGRRPAAGARHRRAHLRPHQAVRRDRRRDDAHREGARAQGQGRGRRLPLTSRQTGRGGLRLCGRGPPRPRPSLRPGECHALQPPQVAVRVHAARARHRLRAALGARRPERRAAAARGDVGAAGAARGPASSSARCAPRARSRCATTPTSRSSSAPAATARVTFALYRDGDGDGVSTADIGPGVDPEVGRRRRLAHLGSDVRLGFPPGRPPPDPGDPARLLGRRAIRCASTARTSPRSVRSAPRRRARST